MEKLTFEEMTAAMVIIQLTRNDSYKTLWEINDLLKPYNDDINMGKVCRWLDEHNYATVDYKKHGLDCIINIGAHLGNCVQTLLEEIY